MKTGFVLCLALAPAAAFVPALRSRTAGRVLRAAPEDSDDPFGKLADPAAPEAAAPEAPAPPVRDTRSQAEQRASPAKKTYAFGNPDGSGKERMSVALPMMSSPAVLDGTLAGDFGFDPLGFAGDDKGRLMYLRDAEIKHARLAMLAAAGWPVSELLDNDLASIIGKSGALAVNSEAPSLLNGGLEKINPFYWVICLAFAGIVELTGLEIQEAKMEAKQPWVPGDYEWDPLNLLPSDDAGKQKMMLAEIKHGRLAMVAITAFAAQEFVSKVAVVNETPAFFQPFGGLFGAHW